MVGRLEVTSMVGRLGRARVELRGAPVVVYVVGRLGRARVVLRGARVVVHSYRLGLASWCASHAASKLSFVQATS